MSIVSEVKCPRCDRRYSGIRGRCPYCGARRTGRGKQSGSSENAKGKMIIGLLLMGVLIIAVVVLLVSSLGGNKPEENEGEVSPPSILPTGDSTESTDGTEIDPPIDDIPTSPEDTVDEEPPSPIVQSVIITYAKAAIKDNDFTLSHIGDSLPLGVKTVPENTDEVPVWSSSNEDVFVVTQSGVVTGTGRGSATLTVKVGDATSECIVRVN